MKKMLWSLIIMGSVGGAVVGCKEADTASTGDRPAAQSLYERPVETGSIFASYIKEDGFCANKSVKYSLITSGDPKSRNIVVCKVSKNFQSERREFLTFKSVASPSKTFVGCQKDDSGSTASLYAVHWEDKDFGYVPDDLSQAYQALMLGRLQTGYSVLSNLNKFKAINVSIYSFGQRLNTTLQKSEDTLVGKDFQFYSARYTLPYGTTCD